MWKGIPDNRIVTHDEPAWRSRAGYIFQFEYEDNLLRCSEQGWAREVIEDTVLEVCCIPFVANTFAMGDWIQEVEEDVYKPVKHCGASVIRMFPKSKKSKDIENIFWLIRENAGLMEISKKKMIAVHCATEQIESLMITLCEKLLEEGKITSWHFGYRPERS